MVYQDSSRTPQERAKDLLSRMSIEEKFAQVQCDFMERVEKVTKWPHGLGNVSCLAASIWENRQMTVDCIRSVQEYVMAQSEHHIPAIFHIETATGVLMPEASVYPNELARAASWNPSLEKEIGTEIGRQARVCGISQGLAPVLDLCRDPRMGRQGESLGEDPTLAAAMGVAYVQGLQNEEHPEEGIMACAKHFLGFMSSMGGIHAAKVTAGARELQEVYGKAFQAAISEANLRSVMNCYSAVEGIPAAGNKKLLTDLLRDEMGFDGVVSADYCSISQLHSVHRLRESMALAGEMAMDAGMDCELPSVETFNEELLERFKSGEADVTILDRAVERLLIEKFRLGLFENPYPKSDEEIREVMEGSEVTEKNSQAVDFDLQNNEALNNVAAESRLKAENNKGFNKANTIIADAEDNDEKKDEDKENPDRGGIKAEKLSLQAARECMVLLKNNGVLPINGLQVNGNENTNTSEKSKGKKIALIGWHGNTTRAFFGCYMNFARQEARLGAEVTMAGTDAAERTSAEVTSQTYPGSQVKVEHPDTDKLARECYPGMKSLYEELVERYSDCEVTYSYGYPFTGNDTSHFAEALAEAESADLVIVTLGGRYGWTTGCTTGEGVDSMDIGLPQCQEEFLEELAKLHKPTIGVHFDGRPCSSDRADALDALMECWTPGVHGAEAVVDILSGRYNPSGRLPVSIARNSGQIPVYYSHERGSGTAQPPSVCFPDYLDGPHAPRYEFGHGLSYSKFIYRDFIVDKKECHADEVIEASIVAENAGSLDGTAVVQLYVTDEYASVSRPVMELIGFAKVELRAGEQKQVVFTIHPSQFAFLDEQMKWKVEKGEYTLKVAYASDWIAEEQKICVLEDAWIRGRDRRFYCNTKGRNL